jgi:hypothetical protein
MREFANAQVIRRRNRHLGFRSVPSLTPGYPLAGPLARTFGSGFAGLGVRV